MDTPSLPRAAAPVVGEFLRRLDAALPVRRRVRREVLAELGDGLACAVEHRMSAGAAPAQAAAAAVAELGDPDELAAAQAAELVPLSAHRIGVALVLSGPVVGLTWAMSTDPATTFAQRVAEIFAHAPLYPLLLLVVVPAALVATVGAGAPARRLPALTPASGAAAVVATVGCVLGDSMLLTAVGRALAQETLTGWLLVATAASVLRLATAAVAARRVVRLRLASG